ncbi:expressed unknown protein [Seminavis robusta]|uniref:Uncharacterized protein n=1 Tax=Seminavis robusta TaxID=568900 RepID=A0A9N8DZ40_9STRA|nr:expressed unknown protein [Seminavis robusta]|eukprot:Sro484_g152310.1 n/a (280) ;mRNA; r:57422-58261
MLKAKFLGNIHCPPRGVVAEPLHSGPCKRFQDSNCPREVFDLMNRKGAVTAYHDMMDEISADENTRDRLGVLKLKAIDTIVERFRPRFSKCGVKVVVCVADYRCNLYRWIEFVDSGAITYISPYNFKNTAGPKLKTALSTIKFQKGVAVEEFRQALFGKRGRLVKQTPKHVEIMIREKGLQEEYERLIQDCIHEGVGGFLGRWDIGKLREVIQHYRPLFQDKGVALFLCHTQEHVPSVEGGERIEYFRWMEFVDRNKLPHYRPEHNGEYRHEDPGCAIL